jgi:ribonuclease HI
MIKIYCDGACSGNPGPGGWAAIIKNNNSEREVTGICDMTTNQQMELTAAVGGLKAIGEVPQQVEVITDSELIVNAFNKGWVDSWQKNGWHTSKKLPVKNKELWEKLITLTEKHQVKFTWTKGHNGDPYNERANALAQTKAQEAKNNLPSLEEEKEITSNEKQLFQKLINLGYSGELTSASAVIIIDESGDVNVVKRSAVC